MGYSTEFEGTLYFTEQLTAEQSQALDKILGEDVRDHDEWEHDEDSYVTYIDLEVTRDNDGIKWDGSEKTYGLDEAVNIVLREMRKQFPTFGLTGQIRAQGESMDDRWILMMDDDGDAVKQDVVFNGKKITCPHCEETIYLEEGE